MNWEITLRYLDSHTLLYWLAAVGATLALLAAALWPNRNAITHSQPASRWIFPLLMLLVLICWRWPFLLYGHELNTDESQFIAGAMTLRHDFLFWRSVDGMTAGPLVYYALVPWTLLGVPLNYFIARLTAVILIWVALWLCYRALRNCYGEGSARLGVLPGLIYVASIASDSLNHYSSELVSLPLTAAGVALLCSTHPNRSPGYRNWLLLGLVAGLHPWAKLQTGPIGAVLGLFGLLIILNAKDADTCTKIKQSLGLMVGALLPAIVVVIATIGGGVWSDFYQSYILQNLIYAGEHLQESWLPSELSELHPPLLTFWLGLGSSLALVLLSATNRQKKSRLFFLGGSLVAIALFCILFPGRPFLHYVQLLLVPTVIWSGAALGECRKSTNKNYVASASLAIILTGTAGLLITRLMSPLPSMLGKLEAQWTAPFTEVDSVIDLLTEPGEKLAIWGWDAQPYVKCALIQGTRDAYSDASIIHSPLRDYHRRRYLADFRRNRPEVLLDSVGPNAIFYQNRSDAAHETFPEFSALIVRDYALVIDLDYARIYARRDILIRRNITASLVQQALARGHMPDWISQHLPEENLREQHGNNDRINGQNVLMMLPPSRAEWTLRGDEREIIFQAGYAPRALNQPDGDGTGFELELHAPDGTQRSIHSFLINPRDNPSDKVPRTRRVPLPPFEPGTKLLIRTNPGPGQNDAWDWAYLANVRFLRSPNYTWQQFPGFNRMPTTALSPLSSYLTINEHKTLILHAPSQFSYDLNAHEHHLQFAFGYAEGAYQQGGHTNGAIFSVTLYQPHGNSVIVFSRHLRPITSTTDRGRQYAEVSLPAVTAGSKLVVTIDPAGDNAYDWTYLTNLQLY